MASTTSSQALVHSGILWQDQQHTELLRCVRRLQQQILERRLGSAEVNDTKAFLQWYVRMHFAAEDAYMEQYNYPKMAEHQHLHKIMAEQLDHLFQVIDDGMGNPDLHACADLCVKLNRWYLTHIAGPDQELAAFLKERGVA